MNRHLAAFLAIGLVAAACTTTTSPSPSTAPGSEPAPTSTSAGGGCTVPEQEGRLTSNTLVTVEVSSDGINDIVTFTLGEPASNPAGGGTGHLAAVEPPFTQGGSGEEVEVLGAHHVEVRFSSMAITDDDGNPTFVGESTFKPDMLALKQVEMTEAFEGVYSFVIGYDGNGCVGLTSDDTAKTVTITIGH